MKTIKYYIEFEMCDTPMSNRIALSKKDYQAHLTELTKQVEATKDNETPLWRMDTLKYDNRTYIEKIETFLCGCARTYLTKLECKKGYYFTK